MNVESPRQLEHGSKGYEALVEELASGPGPSSRPLVVLEGGTADQRTEAARSLAGRIGLPLFRVDLSQVVSKYIGETEKNLEGVFSRAEALDVILLLDEADALLGKRTEVSEAEDRYANQETSFLLQRLEGYEGIAILSTNLRERINEAWWPRTAAVVALPGADEKKRTIARWFHQLLQRVWIGKTK